MYQTQQTHNRHFDSQGVSPRDSGIAAARDSGRQPPAPRFAPDLSAALTALADRWCAATGLALTTLAHRAISSSTLFKRIEEGRTLTVANWQRVADYLADPAHWPDGTAPELVLSIDGVRFGGTDAARAPCPAACNDKAESGRAAEQGAPGARGGLSGALGAGLGNALGRLLKVGR